jgi:DNA uptake protein ComE-like DNA-binding protein
MKRLVSLTRTAATTGALTIGLALGAQAQVGKSVTIMDPNVAGEKELAQVPHLSAAIVKGIMEKRPFLSQTELNTYLTSQGLTKEQLTQVYGKLFVHINLNTASKEEIQMIPGVGAKMLHEFEEYRPYPALARFHREIDKYVDDTELARLEQYVFVPINLNTASDADIQTIPGVGAKMLHEFKEYRPYPNIEKFRREIGKYVNAKEVARLERYVTLK